MKDLNQKREVREQGGEKSFTSDGEGQCVTVKSLFLLIRTREEEECSKSHLSTRVNTPEEQL